MHMADALLSPAVGGLMWGASATVIGLSSRKVAKEDRPDNVPMMGVLGAFVFAAQMINFSIPGTGSSGHIGGALLLAILLGPHAGFLVVVSVLIVQALFFADGGILALGANMINVGFFACFLAYPLVYRPLAGRNPGRVRLFAAAVPAAITGLAAGAVSVVLQTVASGISLLPFGPFLTAMLPVHLVIGAVEGFVTGFVLIALRTVEPGIAAPLPVAGRPRARTGVLIGVLAATLVIAGAVTWFASRLPDGLESSIRAVAGDVEIAADAGPVHRVSGWLQERLSVFAGYGLRNRRTGQSATSAAGLAGAGLTLVAIFGAAFVIRKRVRGASGADRGNADAVD